MSKVIAIYTCNHKGDRMQSTETATLVSGSGIAGDRYATQKGAFSKEKRNVGEISLIAIEAIKEANTLTTTPFDPAETRRNIVTEGVDLNSLVGQEFLVGSIRVFGTELADPCTRPSKLAQKPNFRVAFEGRGGLRALVLSDGLISVGDSITI